MQTVDSPAATEQTSKFRPPRRPIMFALAGLAVLLVVGLFALRMLRPDVLPNTTLAGIDVGGMNQTRLRATVEDLADERAADMITVEQDERRRSATNATVGYAIDVDATVAAVWRRGRSVNPVRALSDHARATFGSITVAPVEEIDDAAIDRWARGVAEALAVPPREGTVRFVGTRVRRRDPRPGRRPAVASLDREARAAFVRPGSDTLDVEAEPVRPRTSAADVDQLVRTARTIVSAPIELYRRNETLRLDPETIAGLYRVRHVADGETVTPQLTIVRSRLDDVLTDDVLARLESAPRDATVVLTGGGPQVRNSRKGFRVDHDEVRSQIDELARADVVEDRSARIAGDAVTPDRTTKDARQLRITQKVSSFTTEHACCQGRVTNIHRFADIMDGVLIEPGETFSLNGHVGPRTAAKGFVAGGAIQRGEYVEELGGGVSQFATTFFNAAYFGGYEILDHKPHSYYISRYPVGRESTINYPTVDVEIRNDSPYGLLVDTSYTNTSITVTFWGRKWVDVESTTGSPHNYTSPRTDVRVNPDLPAGDRRVIQSGKQGFDVVVTRRLRYENGETKTEEYFTRYLAEPRIVERGPANTG